MLLILSPGRRVELVKAFKKELNKTDKKVFAADMSKLAPALYEADKYFTVKKDFDNLRQYVTDIVNICVKNEISFVLTLIDPELKLLIDNERLFKKNKITLIMPNEKFIKNTFDKFLFFQNYKSYFPLLETFKSINDLKDYYNGIVPFPIIAKERYGSASAGIEIIKNMHELKSFDENDKLFVFQKYINKVEFGADLFFDIFNNNLIDLFLKEKISMRSGETDKSISSWNEKAIKILLKLNTIDGLRGPIDVDIFYNKDNGEFYINEINPRFGGGYFHAHYSGCNFVKYIVNNMLGRSNNAQNFPSYDKDIIMMKYNAFSFLKS